MRDCIMDERYLELQAENEKLREIKEEYRKKIEEYEQYIRDEEKLLKQVQSHVKRLETQNNYLMNQNQSYQRMINMIKRTLPGKIAVKVYNYLKVLKKRLNRVKK